jgi:hypothetical protein
MYIHYINLDKATGKSISVKLSFCISTMVCYFLLVRYLTNETAYSYRGVAV